MDFPFNYIVLIIMETLKLRYRKTIITTDMLVKYLKKIIYELNLSGEELEELTENFDFAELLDDFILKYSEYVVIDGDDIIFDEDVLDEELWYMIEESKLDYDEGIINIIDQIIDNDTYFIRVLGIEINDNLFNYMLKNEKELEKLYIKLKDTKNFEERSKIINNIKKHHFFNRIMFFNMHSQLSIDEYDDLVLYASEYAETSSEEVEISLKIENEDEENNLDNTIMRSLMLVDPLYPFNLRDELNFNLKRESNLVDNEDISEFNYYLKLLSLFDEEIEKTTLISLKRELNLAKYRLMNSIDSIFGTNLYMNEQIDLGVFHENYSFIEPTAIYYIDEVYEYSDNEYKNENGHDDLVNYYYSVIKKLIIKAYYELTNDPLVPELIRENPNYKTNTKSAMILEDIINSKNKIKKKI